MPKRREIQSLQELSLESFVLYFVDSWEDSRKSETNISKELNELISCMPYTVSNGFVSEASRYYMRRRRLSNKCLCEFLSCVLVTNLTVLDLQSLVSIGARRRSHVSSLENTLVTAFTTLTRLTRLSLASNRIKTSFPVCTDRMLQEISCHMQNLQVLDVSYNITVSDEGANCLIPRDGKGCPHLEELFVFGCSVSSTGIADVVDGLRNLRIIGYKETGEVLNYLYWKYLQCGDERFHNGLQLTHVNNVGTLKDTNFVSFNKMLVHVTKQLCPKLFNLKVRVDDDTLSSFEAFHSLTVLNVIYNEDTFTLGPESLKYFRQCGTQLSSLTLKCGYFNSNDFLTLGECCPNLQHLWFTCSYMSWDLFDDGFSQPLCNGFSCLRTLYFQVGLSENENCDLSLTLFIYLLKNTEKLTDLRIIARSESLTDMWLRELWRNLKTSNLHKVLIALPNDNKEKGALSLTMLSVNIILEQSPNLQHLGNLRVWTIYEKEIWFLNTYLNMCNYDVTLLHSPMRIH